MLDNLSFRIKNLGLLGLTIVMLLVAYVLSISKTIDLYASNARLSNQIEQAVSAPKQIALLRRQANEMKSMFSLEDQPIDVRGFLMHELSTVCEENNVLFDNFSESASFIKDDLIVETHKATISGNYVDVLQVSYQVSKNLKGARMVSLQFTKEKDRRSKRERLLAHIYIQSILSKDESI